MANSLSKRKIPAISWAIFIVTVILGLINFSEENLNPDKNCMSIFFLGFVVITLDVLDLMTGKFLGKQQQVHNYKVAGKILFTVLVILSVFFFLCMIDFFTIAITDDNLYYFQFNSNKNFSCLNSFIGETIKTSFSVWAYYFIFIAYAVFRLIRSSFVNSN